MKDGVRPMRVNDFQSSTFDLEANLEIFFENEAKVLPLSYLHRFESKTTISVGKKPLKLHELQYGLKFCSPDSILNIENEGALQTLFGFRRVQNSLFLR